jgi:hypothetical protein
MVEYTDPVKTNIKLNIQILVYISTAKFHPDLLCVISEMLF